MRWFWQQFTMKVLSLIVHVPDCFWDVRQITSHDVLTYFEFIGPSGIILSEILYIYKSQFLSHWIICISYVQISVETLCLKFIA